ncbi:hypothetical protein RRG08_045288 [Elysia crispata]|uniref:Uncharacterized protein n=1 Tax=Elysia crispata TaxID=231223 RepID=A0AAE1A252_9GAST|nr:hypothetical protein RRG08_045288 [Elysia crispata]
MEGNALCRAIGVALLATVLVAPSSGVRGSDLCGVNQYHRKSMCISMLNARTSSRALYRFTRDRAVLLPLGMFGLADPANVIKLSEFQPEINKYNAELNRLYEALTRYTTSWVYLAWEQSNVTFKNFVESLRRKLLDARNTVDDLDDSLSRLMDSQPTSAPGVSTETIAASATTASIKTTSTTSPESTDSIQQKANFLTKKLKKLLRLWRNRCNSCGDSRRRRSVFVSRVD